MIVVVPPGLDLPKRGWSLHTKGYVIYTSNPPVAGMRRGRSLHREVMERLAGRKLETEEHVHHQDFDKTHNCPGNLILMPQSMNPSSARRCPVTGVWMSREGWRKRYGEVDWAKVCGMDEKTGGREDGNDDE